MNDDYETTFVVELAPKEVWKRLTERTVEADPKGDASVHYVLPGFPSFQALDHVGASCSVLEIKTESLLRVKKDHEPCAGSEIAVTLEQVGTGTKVTVVQSGFGALLEFAGRDTVFGHGDQIANDFRLYLERRLVVPGTNWGINLGVRATRSRGALELFAVDPGTPAETAGMNEGDLLLTLRGIRLHDIQQLWTVLALTDPGSTSDVTWARGDQIMTGKVTFAA